MILRYYTAVWYNSEQGESFLCLFIHYQKWKCYNQLGDFFMTRPNQQERIYNFIEQAYQKNGFSPSIGEIAEHLSLNAKSNIHRQLQQLVNEGMVKKTINKEVKKYRGLASLASVLPVAIAG